MTVPQMSYSPSVGPRRHPQPDGTVYLTANPCPECKGRIDEGENVTFTPAGWGHLDCIEQVLAEVDAADAWLLLGSQLARRPSHFKAAEIRVIVANLLRAAAGMPVDGWKPGDRRPERRHLAAVPDDINDGEF